MTRVALTLSLMFLTVCFFGGAEAVAAPTQATSISPADGSRFTSEEDIPIELRGVTGADFVDVEVSTSSVAGFDGSLADDFVKTTESLNASDVAAGVWRGQIYDFELEPGHYYWQATGDPPCCDDARPITPILQVDIFPDTHMTKYDAARETERLVRAGATDGGAKNIYTTCKNRVDASTFSCSAGWVTRRNRRVQGGVIKVAYRNIGYERVVRGTLKGLTESRKCVADVVQAGQNFQLDDCPSKPLRFREELEAPLP